MNLEKFPLVSIITPTFNQAEYLAETIESVLIQDYPNIQYIVIDDGSTDSTVEVLKKYGSRVNWFTQTNAGQANTLNRGWQMCAGVYIGYLSSDDLLFPQAISKLVNFLQNDASVCMVYPNCDLIDPKSFVIKKRVCREFDYDLLVVGQECHIGPGALFRREQYEIVGGWKPNLRLAPDREFWMRLGKHGRIAMLDEVLAGYRMHPKSISYFETNPRVAEEYLVVLDDFFNQKNVPSRLVDRKIEAYSNAILILARAHFRNFHITEGFAKYKEAVTIYPPNRSFRTIILLTRSIISKPIRRFIWVLTTFAKRFTRNNDA